MNFHISNLSPLRPQFPSPGARRQHHDAGPVKIEVESADPDDVTGDDQSDDTDTDALSDASADDVTQDSRDVLVQRLTDLAERLSVADVRTGSIETLHRQVDDMERVLRGDSRSRSTSRQSSRRRASGPSASRPKSLQLPPAANGPGEAPRGRESLGVMAPMSPSWFMSHFQRTSSTRKETQVPRETDERASRQHSNSDSMVQQPPPVVPSSTAASPAPNISSEVAEDVVKEAEKLCAEMATVIESLQTRREESDVIPSLIFSLHLVAQQPFACILTRESAHSIYAQYLSSEKRWRISGYTRRPSPSTSSRMSWPTTKRTSGD